MRKCICHTLLPLLLLSLIGAPCLAGPRLAVLVSVDHPSYMEVVAGLEEGIRRAGVKADFDIHRLHGERNVALEAVAKAGQGGADIFIPLGALALAAVLEAAPETPKVAAMVYSRESLVRGGNMTGVYLEIAPEEQLAWLRRILPATVRVGVLYNGPQNGGFIERARAAASANGLGLEALEVAVPQELPAALARLENRIDVLWGINDTVVLTPSTAKRILVFSLRNKIPFVGLSEAWVKGGAFYALHRDYWQIGETCAQKVLAVLNGVPAGEIDPSPPEVLGYSLNRTTLEAMKMDFDSALIKKALTVH